jgi:transaldolase
MTSPLQSLIASGTKLWLDSIDPDLVARNRALGATGATSNPIIVADLIKTGRFDEALARMMDENSDDADVAWGLTDQLVRRAQEVFLPIFLATRGDDGYVSFELDPLLEDPATGPPQAQRTQRYIELGRRWSRNHQNRMIKVPATPAGLAALPDLAAAGIKLNVTLIFTERQYRVARDNIWAGAQRREGGLTTFKSVYSIFISRIDVYTKKHLPNLSPAAQGQVGLVIAKRMWQNNRAFWADKNTPLRQEIIFASTGTKDPHDPPDKYVAALAGSDIETNPPATNEAAQQLGKTYVRRVDELPAREVLDEIDRQVDMAGLEEALLGEGVAKFAQPQKALLELIAGKRRTLAEAR